MNANILANIMGMGTQEMVIIFLIVLLLFGAKKLPQLARGVGKSMGEFKKARDEFENEIQRAEHDVTSSDKTISTEKKDKSDDA